MSTLTVLAVAVLVVLLAARLLGGGGAMASTIREKLAAGATVVDVRSPEEFRSGAYPGALNIPVQELGRRLGDLRKDAPVVLYCASGARSALAARALRQAGFKDVVNAGGLDDMPR